MPKLLYQGHGSYRLIANDGRVIFVDPYAGKGYDVPADIILVTHQHHDHNKIKRVTQKPDCRIISNIEALAGGKHKTFDLGGGLTVEAVEASNAKHDPRLISGARRTNWLSNPDRRLNYSMRMLVDADARPAKDVRARYAIRAAARNIYD